MGNFYVNHTVRTEDRDKVAAVLRRSGHTAYVSPAKNGCVVVAEKEADTQDTDRIVSLARSLSVEGQAPVLAVLDHDDDCLALGLYVSGQEIADYSSDPDFIPADKETSLADRAAKLCAAFDAAQAVETVTAILGSTTYVFAYERHQALVDALGLSDFAICYGFGDLEQRPDEATQWLKTA